jgi:hypothetical protein
MRRVSRAMNVSLAEADVAARCQKAGVAISAIEMLPQGGTHVVLVTSEGADTMRDLFSKQIIDGRVKRFAFMQSRPAPLNMS